MVVQRLIEFADNYKDLLLTTGLKWKELNGLIDVNMDGYTYSALKNRYLCVPDISRTSNVKPTLLVDKLDYVFGYYEKGSEREKSKARHEAYLNLLEEYITVTGDEEVELVI